ncbi:MAG: hypothetical protein COB12_07675 [Flavobacterium sp.]|nr:MAG: hypothetical protein COB12_07675 [Flavobacterium sp.]
MNKKIVKRGLIIIALGIVIGGGIFLYMFFQPHRDVQATKTDFQLEAKQIVDEYLKDANVANDKYLQEEGDSKIIEVSGVISEISEDFNNQKVLLLKGKGENAGVSCTFTSATNKNAATLKVGDQVTIKGVIRSGAGYDEDMEMYEDVIMEKCDIVSK